MDNTLKFEWLTEELKQYTEKQQELLLRAIEALKKSAKLLEDEYKNGNDYELVLKKFERSRFTKEPRLPEEKGEGYLLRDDSFQVLNKIRDANIHFFNRIVAKYEELNGPLKEYKKAFLLLEQHWEEPLRVTDVFYWIELQLNGEALKKWFAEDIKEEEISLNKDVIQVKPSKKNERFEGYIRKMYYSEGYYEIKAEPLMEALLHFEEDVTPEMELHAKLCLQKWESGISKEDLKRRWVISKFKKTMYVQFYANGRFDINFRDNECAETFYKNYLINKTQ